MEKIARFLGGEKSVESCHASRCLGFDRSRQLGLNCLESHCFCDCNCEFLGGGGEFKRLGVSRLGLVRPDTFDKCPVARHKNHLTRLSLAFEALSCLARFF